jgi:hypothetical protein
MKATLASWWYAFANAAGGFIEEAIFRVTLAGEILVSRVPRRVERRWWNRAAETPVLVDVYSWVDDRLIFSVLVWPSLEVAPEKASYAHRERAELVRYVIAKGASEMMWSTRFETDYGLRWDPERRVWTTEDGFAYDGERLYDYSRQGEVAS